MNDFSDNTSNYGILTQIWLQILRFDPDCKIQTHFGGRRKLFCEECSPGKDSTLNFIQESSVNSIFIFLEILRFEIISKLSHWSISPIAMLPSNKAIYHLRDIVLLQYERSCTNASVEYIALLLGDIARGDIASVWESPKISRSCFFILLVWNLPKIQFNES